MRFFVIYSVDVTQGESLQRYTPRGRSWSQTESGKTEYSYLGGEWEKGKHRKYVAEDLSRKQFDHFVSQMGLSAEDTETMGSMSHLGWLPAISFRSDAYSAIVNAYVTPMPETTAPDSEEKQRRVWERLRRAIINVYR